MSEYHKGSHTVYDIKYHFVWLTKYRYKILEGDLANRLRELIRQICESRKIKIIKGHLGKEHIHLLVAAPPNIAPCKIMQYIKGVSSRRIQQEFPAIRKRYWGQHIWAQGYFCATSGTVTDEMIKLYIENQKLEGPTDNFSIVGENPST